jgi:preprotein translocase subunit YajC
MSIFFIGSIVGSFASGSDLRHRCGTVAKQGFPAIVRRHSPKPLGIHEKPMQDLLTSPFVPLIFVLVVMYFMLMRPQQQRLKQLRNAIANVRRGDTVITAGGHIATVSKPVKPEDEHVTVEIADGVHTKVLKSTLTEVRPKSGDAKADKD